MYLFLLLISVILIYFINLSFGTNYLYFIYFFFITYNILINVLNAKGLFYDD